MKKNVVSIVIIGVCFIVAGTAFIYAEPRKNINELWGKVLATEYKKDKKIKKDKKYKLALNGKHSEKTESIEGIAEEGQDVLITRDEIEKVKEFYEINGDSEKAAYQKAVDYVEEENAIYVEAIKKGYDVTDEELDKYIEELKKTVSIADNKEVAEEIISSFSSEKEYWEYERELYKKLLPIQKYVKNLEKDFAKKNINKNGDENNREQWNKKFGEIKRKAVKKQNFKNVNKHTEIDKKFIEK